MSTSKHLEKLLDASTAIYLDRPSAEETAWMARQLVQATLPHSDPGDVAVWSRTNGNLTLSIQPGMEKGKSLGLPYGSLPRLLLFWITTEAIKTQNRRLELGNTLSDFLEQLGLRQQGGQRGDITRLRKQMKRLFTSRISFDYTDHEVDKWLSMEIAPEGELWWDFKNPSNASFFNSWIELGEKFYHAMIAAPVPVDMRALNALKKSPLALDLYAWSTYTTYSANKTNKPRSVSWDLLHKQFGGDYAEVRNFQTKAMQTFKKIRAVYPDLTLETVKGGIKILPGGTAILSKPAADKATRAKRMFPNRQKTSQEPLLPLRTLDNCVTADAIEKAHQLASQAGTGWSIDALERAFYAYARQKGEPLKSPNGAFIGFVKRKIKKRPA
jgi:Plasmid encoded RepA protein